MPAARENPAREPLPGRQGADASCTGFELVSLSGPDLSKPGALADEMRAVGLM